VPAKKAPSSNLIGLMQQQRHCIDFWMTFVLNNNDSKKREFSGDICMNNQEPKTESEFAYETLKSDLTSVENNNQTIEIRNNKSSYVQETATEMKKQNLKQ
jgi:hypothetical protein